MEEKCWNRINEGIYKVKEYIMGKQKIERGNTRLAVKVGFWYVASTFLIKSMALITTPIFARIMDTEAYGEFSNFVSWRSILLVIVGLELYNTLPRAYYDYRRDFDEYASTITIFSGIVTCFFYIIFLAGKSFFLGFVTIPKEFIHILFISLLFASCKNIYLTREKTLYHYKSVALISVIDGIIPTLVSIIAVLIVSDSLKLPARIYGFYFTSLITGIVCGLVILWRGRRFKGRYCSYAVKLAFPLQINFLTIYLLTNTNTIIAKNIMGATSSAVVSISTSVLHIVTVLFQSMNGAITTWLMDKLEQKKYREAGRESLVYIAFLSIITLGTILLAPEVVLILGGKKYIEATVLIPGMAAASLIQAVVSIFTVILTYDKNVVKTASFTGIIAVASIVLKILLLPVFGMLCLPYVNLMASIMMFIVNYILVRMAGYRSAVHLKGACLILATVMLFMFTSYYLYAHSVIRYTVICLIFMASVTAAIKSRGRIRALLRK